MSVQITEQYVETYEREICISCGIKFYLPADYQRQRLSDGKGFHCPNGHTMYYGENDKVRLEKARADLARAQSQIHLERDQRLAAEAATVRLKKRVARGVCPCCKRTVSQLARHMADKHPAYPKAA